MKIFNNINFWKVRKLYLDLIFIVKRFIFLKTNTVKTFFEDLPFKKRVIIEIIKNSFLSIFFIGIVSFFEKSTIHYLEFFSDKLLLQQIYNIITNCNLSLKEHIDLVSDFLLGIISIVGIYLGLYCSNMMSIFSNTYANIPKEISSLFENDIITNKHISLITKYLFFSISLLVINIVNENITIFLFTVFVLYGFAIIVTYGFSSKRTYQFSDVFYVARYLHSELYKIIALLSKKGIILQDKNLQNYYKTRAKKILFTLQIVNNYCLEDKDANAKSIENFIGLNFTLLNEYWKIKRLIPYDSLWYDEKTVYKKWYNADHHEVSIAVNTGTTINTIQEKNIFWFEDNIFTINEKCLNYLISKQENANSIPLFTNYFQQLSKASIEANCLDFLLKKIDNITHICAQIIRDNPTADEMLLSQEIIRTYSKILIDLRIYIESIDIKDDIGYVFGPEAMISPHENKYHNFETIRNIYVGIKYELKYEGKIITPSWFVEQSIAKIIYEETIKNYSIVEKIINDSIPSFNDQLLKSEKYGGLVISCILLNEINNKSKLLLSSLNNLISSLEKYHIEHDIPWQNNPSKRIEKNIELFFDQLPQQWANYTSIFTIKNWNDITNSNIPDILGDCFNHVANHLINAVANKDFVSFKNTYKSFLGITILYQQKIQREFKDSVEPYRETFKANAISNPFIELSIISGYAYILGEILNQSEWKELLEETFKNWITNTTEKDNMLSFIYNAFNWYRDTGIYHNNRYTLHISWSQLINRSWRDMKELSWKQGRFYEVLDSDNALLCTVIGYRREFELLKCDAYEIFAVMVVNKHLSEGQKYSTKTNWEDKLNEGIKV